MIGFICAFYNMSHEVWNPCIGDATRVANVCALSLVRRLMIARNWRCDAKCCAATWTAKLIEISR